MKKDVLSLPSPPFQHGRGWSLWSRICFFFFTCSNLGVDFFLDLEGAFVAPTGSTWGVLRRWSGVLHHPCLVSPSIAVPLLFSSQGLSTVEPPPRSSPCRLSAGPLVSSLLENSLFSSQFLSFPHHRPRVNLLAFISFQLEASWA